MKDIITSQIRLPADMHEYIRQEADRIGISQNAFLLVLLEQGRKVWNANITNLREVK